MEYILHLFNKKIGIIITLDSQYNGILAMKICAK